MSTLLRRQQLQPTRIHCLARLAIDDPAAIENAQRRLDATGHTVATHANIALNPNDSLLSNPTSTIP